ncbi:MAG: hypothetical protein QHI48_04080 [Bacteroidota bacterium]|nr:hypothetical protein [Bacteroidota bacterium]
MKYASLFLIAVMMFLAREAGAQYADVNACMSVGGAGYLSVPYSSAFNGDLNQTGFLSIDAWVYATSLTGYMTIVGNDYAKGYWLGITPQGKIRFYPRGAVLTESSGNIGANQWYHVGVAFDARKGNISFTINGASAGTATVASGGVGSVTSGDLRIGADRSGTSPAYYWMGLLDEVRIWKGWMDFTSAAGLLYKIPHAVYNGRHGQYLVAGWRMNGDGTGIDNTFSGSVVGTVTFPATPDPPHYARIGASFTNRPGTVAAPTEDYFLIPSSSGITLVQNFTIECWVKRASTGGSSTYQTLVTKSSAYSGQWMYWLGINVSTGKLRFVPNGDFSDALESNATIPVGQWTHVAGRYAVSGNTRQATVFVNGVASGVKSYSRDASTNKLPVLIGRGEVAGVAVNDPMGFSGVIDEVRIWNTARSNDEIANCYRLELDGPLSGLLASYHFDGDVLDASGVGNHGRHLPNASSDVYFLSTLDLPPEPTVQVLSPNGKETWFIGASRSIQWASSGLQAVRILLSRDGGNTWPEVLTASTPAASGSYSWVVTGPQTSQARVMVTTTTTTPVQDMSDDNFRIIEPSPHVSGLPKELIFAAPENGPLPAPQKVLFQNTGGGTLQWNASVGTTTWLDVAPTGGSANVDSFEVRVTTTNMPEGTYSGKITVQGNADNLPTEVPVTYRITQKQICSISGRVTRGGLPLGNISIMILGPVTTTVFTDSSGRYTAAGLPCDQYTVIPDNPFYEFTPPLRNYTSLSGNITDADFTAAPKRGQMKFHYREGWNLVSFPIEPADTDLASLIPDIRLPAYLFDPSSGYVETTRTPLPGVALWMRCTRTDSVVLAGWFLPEILCPLTSSYGGWNMIGAPSGASPLSTVRQTPPDIIASVFEYDPVFGYLPPLGGMLRPGRGYFLKAHSNGSVSISASIFEFAPPLFPSLRYPSAFLIDDDLPPPPPIDR